MNWILYYTKNSYCHLLICTVFIGEDTAVLYDIERIDLHCVK